MKEDEANLKFGCIPVMQEGVERFRPFMYLAFRDNEIIFQASCTTGTREESKALAALVVDLIDSGSRNCVEEGAEI